MYSFLWIEPLIVGSGASSAGLWFSRPSDPEWYHERRAVTHVSQDPSPLPHGVSFSHSRPSPCSEFIKKVHSRPKKSKNSLGPRPSGLGSGGETRRPPDYVILNRLLLNRADKVRCRVRMDCTTCGREKKKIQWFRYMPQ